MKITLELRTRVNVAITDRCVQLLALQQTAAVEVKAEFRFVYFFSRNLIGSFFSLLYTTFHFCSSFSLWNKVLPDWLHKFLFLLLIFVGRKLYWLLYIFLGMFLQNQWNWQVLIPRIISIPYRFKKNKKRKRGVLKKI